MIQVKVKVTQSCPIPCDPMDYTVHEILQARIMEWVAYPFSRGSPNPGIKPRSSALQAYSLPTELSYPGEPSVITRVFINERWRQQSLHQSEVV